jgi:hypothetical protein
LATNPQLVQINSAFVARGKDCNKRWHCGQCSSDFPIRGRAFHNAPGARGNFGDDVLEPPRNANVAPVSTSTARTWRRISSAFSFNRVKVSMSWTFRIAGVGEVTVSASAVAVGRTGGSELNCRLAFSVLHAATAKR